MSVLEAKAEAVRVAQAALDAANAALEHAAATRVATEVALAKATLDCFARAVPLPEAPQLAHARAIVAAADAKAVADACAAAVLEARNAHSNFCIRLFGKSKTGEPLTEYGCTRDELA